MTASSERCGHADNVQSEKLKMSSSYTILNTDMWYIHSCTASPNKHTHMLEKTSTNNAE